MIAALDRLFVKHHDAVANGENHRDLVVFPKSYTRPHAELVLSWDLFYWQFGVDTVYTSPSQGVARALSFGLNVGPWSLDLRFEGALPNACTCS